MCPAWYRAWLSQFIGNKYFAFEDKSKAIVKQGSLFLLIEMIAFGNFNVLFVRSAGEPYAHS